MSWLMLNDGLNSIKGQLSNLLNEGIVEETGTFTDVEAANTKIQELQALCTAQETEISALKLHQKELQAKCDLILESNHGTDTVDRVGECITSPANPMAQRLASVPYGDEPSYGEDTITVLRQRLEALQIENSVKRADNQRLANEVELLKAQIASTNNNVSTETELHNLVAKLQSQNERLSNENQDLIVSLNQLDTDCQATTDKLVSLRDVLQVDFNKIRDENMALSTRNEQLEKSLMNIKQVQEECEAFKITHSCLMAEKLKADETLLAVLTELDEVQMRNQQLTGIEEKYLNLNCDFQALEKNVRIQSSNMQEVENKNMQLVKQLEEDYESMKHDFEEAMIRCADFKVQLGEIFCVLNKLLKYNHHVDTLPKNNIIAKELETQLKQLLDCKEKLQASEKSILTITKEKNIALNEKEDVISDLTTNVKILSEDLRHYKQEWNELSNTNQCLAKEVEELRQSNLLTITETNEESFLALENQLDGANNRIKELERIVEECKNEQERDAEADDNLAKNDSVEEFTIIDHQVQDNGMASVETLQVELSKVKKEIETVAKNATDKEKIECELRNELKCSREDLCKERDIRTELLNRFIVLEKQNNESEALIEKLRTLMDAEQKKLDNNLNLMNRKHTTLQEQYDAVVLERNALSDKIRDLEKELESIQANESVLKVQLEVYKKDLEDSWETNAKLKVAEVPDVDISKLVADNAELMRLVSVKHNENIQYHTEIQRLNSVLLKQKEQCVALEQKISVNGEATIGQEEEIKTLSTALVQKVADLEKIMDENTFLHEKCNILTKSLLEEQNKVQGHLTELQHRTEKITTLQKDLERLRQHLLNSEDAHTHELIVVEQKNKELTAKMLEMEQRERDSSNIYTSVSIRANQQVETLQNQIRLATQQRDEYQVKLSEAEDRYHKQRAALTNLQCVLEQFQSDKEKDIEATAESVRKVFEVEKGKRDGLQIEIDTLRSQLNESKQGLKAAARLQEQLEKARHQICSYNHEVATLQEKMAKMQKEQTEMSTQFDAKVDKLLAKNLVVSYVASSAKERDQILKIIATVLDFTKTDYDKLNIGKTTTGGVGGSWLASLLRPGEGAGNMTQQSLSEAFVRFLEHESTPKAPPPPLRLNVERRDSVESTTSSQAATNLLNEFLLPTFNNFVENRNSSSILKDVLNDS